MTGVDWGHVPSWITAVGSVAAFVTAAWAALQGKRAANAAWKQVEHLKEQKEQEQASKVAAWLSVEKQHYKRDDPAVVLRYTNLSDLPVYRLKVASIDYPTSLIEPVAIVEPASSASFAYLENLTRRLNHVYEQELAYDREWLGDIFAEEELKESALWVAESKVIGGGLYTNFYDSRNVAWCRESNGVLRKPRLDSEGYDIDDPSYNVLKKLNLRSGVIRATENKAAKLGNHDDA